MAAIDDFHKEMTSKGYKLNNPGLETTFDDAECVDVTDPFSNKIRFNENMKNDT